MDWEQPKSVSFSLEISNLSFTSWTHDLGTVLIRVESSSSCSEARQVDGDTNTSAPLSSTPSDQFFLHPLAHLSCPRLLLLWPKLLARHNLKLSSFLFWPTCRWLLPPSLPIFQHLSPLLWAPWAPVWRVVGSTRTVQASLTLDGVEALLYLFNPWSQRPLKVLLRMQGKYIGMINRTPPSSSLPAQKLAAVTWWPRCVIESKQGARIRRGGDQGFLLRGCSGCCGCEWCNDGGELLCSRCGCGDPTLEAQGSNDPACKVCSSS